MMFWSSAAQVAAKMDCMRAAEAKLFSFARKFGDQDPSSYEMELFDTPIPAHVVPLQTKNSRTSSSCESQDELNIHGIRLVSKQDKDDIVETPLVIQHGYMNGALYFYRNLLGLTSHFRTVIAIDMLGWGLSSRPAFKLRDKSVQSTEEFFVESLETWRQKNNIEKMILAGHSMGGYMVVAYAEQYPERVERLILLSPAGVPTENKQLSSFRENASFRQRLFLSVYTKFFESGTTPCSVLRTLPKKKGMEISSSYVRNRLPAIDDLEEQAAVTDYLYYNSVLPPSGEQSLNRILNPTTLAKRPLVNRIPHLKVSHVSFLYGASDWMDSTGGMETQIKCDDRRNRGQPAPRVQVHSVRNAGHLLMLDNWAEVNAGIIMAVKGRDSLLPHSPIPVPLTQERQPKVERFSTTESATTRPRAVEVSTQA